MFEPAGMDPVEDFFAYMSERSVSEIMSQSYSFRKIFIIGKYSGDGTRDLGYFKSMCKARSVMISFRSKKDLSLMYQPSECL